MVSVALFERGVDVDMDTVKQIGHAILDVKLPNGELEQYLITLPTLQIQGVWMGSPYTELSQTSHIQSSTGWHATVSYLGFPSFGCV